MQVVSRGESHGFQLGFEDASRSLLSETWVRLLLRAAVPSIHVNVDEERLTQGSFQKVSRFPPTWCLAARWTHPWE